MDLPSGESISEVLWAISDMALFYTIASLVRFGKYWHGRAQDIGALEPQGERLGPSTNGWRTDAQAGGPSTNGRMGNGATRHSCIRVAFVDGLSSYLRFTFYVLRFTFYALRFTLVSRRKHVQPAGG